MQYGNMYALMAASFPADATSVAIESGSLLYTYDDIERASATLANLLASLNLPSGARIAVQVEKSPEALLLYLATLRAGYVYLPLNTAYRESEIAYFLDDAQPSVVVGDPRHASWMSQAARRAVPDAHFFTLDDQRGGTLLSSAQGLAQTFETVERADEDAAAILYTSGTTGRSKGAVLSHGNLASNALTLRQYWGWRQDDVLLHTLPLFHVHGLFVAAQGALLAGARMLWFPKFDVEQALAALPRATIFMGVPTYYVRLLADSRLDRALVAQVRLFVSGSAPLLAETFNAFAERVGQAIVERYGMSETNMLTSNPYGAADGARLGGTVGRPLPGVSVRVVADDNAMVAPGEIGSVQVRGPNVFSGYWRMPEKTREAFTEDGYFITGDLGQWGDGQRVPRDYLSIVGRSKDLIISGGLNVYPKEIELILDEMPGVEESAVVGMPDPDFGEAVTAFVVARAGHTLDVAAMAAQLKGAIANFKVPKRITVVPELPRNTMGKVQKSVLRERIE